MTGDRYFRLEVGVFARGMEDWLWANGSTGDWQYIHFYEIVDRTGDKALELREAEPYKNAPVNGGVMGVLKKSSLGLVSRDPRRKSSLWPQPLRIAAIGQKYLSAFGEVEEAFLSGVHRSRLSQQAREYGPKGWSLGWRRRAVECSFGVSEGGLGTRPGAEP